MNSQEGKPASLSKVTITELMIPSYANFGGKIHGGILLSLMDKAAYAAASKHSGTYCVTVSVETVDFLQPVEVGQLVSLKANINYVGNSSMVVGIKVISENVKTREIKHTNTSYFTMVAKDENDKPQQVPPLILEDKTDVRRFVEAVYRRRLKKESKENFTNFKKNWNQDEINKLLADERCIQRLNQ
jgi:uncharacterized protein (TIGR00369 family)